MAQQQADTNNARLGMPMFVRSGHALLETWSAGSAFREHDRRVLAAQQRRRDLEDQKKEVRGGGRHARACVWGHARVGLVTC